MAITFALVKIYVDLSCRMRKYYAAVNSIISHIKYVNYILKLNLLEMYTLHTYITYILTLNMHGNHCS